MQRAKKPAIDPNALFAGVAEMPGGLDPEFERERAQAEESKELDDWDWDGSFDGFKALPFPFKIHLGVALLVSVGVFLGFRYAANPSPSQAIPWWLLPWFFFSTTLVGHYFFSIREYWKGSFIIVLVLTTGLYLVNKIFTPEFDWYLVPLSVAAMVATAFDLGGANVSLVKIVTYEYFIVCIISFVLWVNLQALWTGFPWFVYPVLTLGLIAVVWTMYREYQIRKYYPYSLAVGISITLQCLFTWAFVAPSENTWPWWLLVLGFFALLTLGLFMYTEGCYLCPPPPEGGDPNIPQPTVAGEDPQPEQELSLTQFIAKKAFQSVMNKF